MGNTDFRVNLDRWQFISEKNHTITHRTKFLANYKYHILCYPCAIRHRYIYKYIIHIRHIHSQTYRVAH